MLLCDKENNIIMHILIHNLKINIFNIYFKSFSFLPFICKFAHKFEVLPTIKKNCIQICIYCTKNYMFQLFKISYDPGPVSYTHLDVYKRQHTHTHTLVEHLLYECNMLNEERRVFKNSVLKEWWEMASK